MFKDKKILLIISGGIAAYKSLDLIRRLREQDATIRTILTDGGAQFITPLSISALSGEKVYSNLFSLTDEQEMGHIKLARDHDVILVCPASADMIAKMAGGFASDLASTVLLAADKPVYVAPAMNPMMWQNLATQNNLSTLKKRGIHIIQPAVGAMACNEEGMGRLAEITDIIAAISQFNKPSLAPSAASAAQPLKGRHVIVTSGPTYEAIDPVRFIGNKSSGKQGHAVAKALSDLGARITLITGPVHLADPPGVHTVHVTTADEMQKAIAHALPADIAVCAAAVSDWRAATVADQKMKKVPGTDHLSLNLTKNPDLLAWIATHLRLRPQLVVGFAAETENLIDNAKTKLQTKNCDWILANLVSNTSGFGKDENQITFVSKTETIHWPMQSKQSIAEKLATKIVAHFAAVPTATVTTPQSLKPKMTLKVTRLPKPNFETPPTKH